MNRKRTITLLLLAALAFMLPLLIQACSTATTTVPTPVLPLGEKIPVEVLFSTPQGEVDSIDQVDAILAGFNQAMVWLQPIPADENAGPLQIQPRVEGKYRWKGTATLAFVPAKPLPYSTRFTATVPKGTKSLRGTELAQDYVWSFESPRPNLVESVPMHEAELVETDSLIFLYFNQPMDPSSAASSITLTGEDRKGKKAALGFDLRSPKENELKSPVAEGEESSNPMEEWEPARVLVVVPQEKLKPDHTYHVTIAKGLRGAEGDLTSKEEGKLSFATFNTLALTGIEDATGLHPEDTLRVEFSNPVSPAEFLKNASFNPPIKIPDYYQDDTETYRVIYLDLPLKARSIYTLQVKSDLKDRFGNRLGKEARTTFTTIDFRPALTMGEGMGILESAGDRRFPVGFMNLDSVRLSMAAIPPAGIIPLCSADDAFYSSNSFTPAGGYPVDRDWKPDLPRNTQTDLPVAMKEALGDKNSGFVYLQIKAPQVPDEYNRIRKILIQVTNLGLTAKFSPENTLIWVTTLSDARPVAGANLEIRDDANNVIWRGRSDGKGLARAPGWAVLGLKQKERWDQPRQWVFAEKDGQHSFVNSSSGTGVSPWDFDLNYEWSPKSREFAGHAFSERGLYRAGEEVFIKGTIREKRQGRWEIPQLDRIRYTITDARDRRIEGGELRLSDYGSFDHTIKLAADAPSGFYVMSLRLPKALAQKLKYDEQEPLFETSFRVEAYRPAQFEVTVKPARDAYVFGEDAAASIKGWYLFGAPMKGEAASWEARLDPMDFRPPGWDGYDFGPG